jgi:hypothetical protein
MEKLKIKISQTVESLSYMEIPKYFRINHSQYYKIVSDKSYVLVSYYGTTKEEMEGLTVYPKIEIKMVDHLYIYIQGKDLIELTKEQFTEQFDACMTFIDQL